jgi:hypothetical protein
MSSKEASDKNRKEISVFEALRKQVSFSAHVRPCSSVKQAKVY